MLETHIISKFFQKYAFKNKFRSLKILEAFT